MADGIAKYDDDGFFKVPLTRAQCEEAEKYCFLSDAVKRQATLYLYEGQAHLAHRALNFDDYYEKKFGKKVSPGYLRQIIMWARVEREVIAGGLSVDLLGMPNNFADFLKSEAIQEMGQSRITNHIAGELAKLPPSERREAWEEAKSMPGVHDHTLSEKVTHIVRSRVQNSARIAAGNPRQEDTPVFVMADPKPRSVPTAAVTKKPDTAPVVPMIPTPQPPMRTISLKVEPDWIDALDTMKTWCENDAVDNNPEVIKQTTATLYQMIIRVTDLIGVK